MKNEQGFCKSEKMNFDPQLTAITTEFTSEVVFNGINEHNKCI